MDSRSNVIGLPMKRTDSGLAGFWHQPRFALTSLDQFSFCSAGTVGSGSRFNTR